MTEDQTNLVSENHNLIYSFLWKYRLKIDDYYDLAAIGLCKAAITFDPKRGLFSTYAYQCMFNEIKIELRKAKSVKRIPDERLVYFQQKLENNNGDTMEIENLFPSIENTEEQVISEMTLGECTKNLKEKDKKIILLLADGYKQHEVGQIIGCSQAQVSRVRKNLKKKMGE